MADANRLLMRLAIFSLAIAGICFVLYPSIRPFSNESTLKGAEAFASSEWVIAHSLAMIGFILVTLGLFGVYCHLRNTIMSYYIIPAFIVMWIGIGLTLPYYGAETFALHAVGKEALKHNNVDLLVTLTNSIRFGEGVWFFGFGLIAIAFGAILFAIAVWRSGTLSKWSGIPLAIGFVLFIPQFYTPQPMRIAHGILILVGCWLIAWDILKHRKGTDHSR